LPVPARARATRLGALVFLLVALALLVVTVVIDHGSDHSRQVTTATLAPTTTTRVATTTSAARTTTTRAPAITAAPTTTAPPVATEPPVATAPPTAPPATDPPSSNLLVNHIGGIGSAQQVIAVATNGYGTSAATLTAYERDGNGWREVFGPWFANVGRNGVAPYGAKREGDGRTPSGVYGLDFMFGVEADPGTHYPYRRITGSNIVWDDDSNSANYNRWIDTSTASAGVGPEPMYNTPSYNYGAVIAYNTARTPGLGSAIFLHVSHGSSTAGCVAVPTDQLLALLRWLDPGRAPVIAIGTLDSLSA
jgi:L,D-peptidoglycan transpeptidase YkuD (ErfK/YbiS/YcfS/YnhG family)